MDLERDPVALQNEKGGIICTLSHSMEATVTLSDSDTAVGFFPFWRRPRLLYTTVFVWISITGGRFLASFLEQEASLSPAAIGAVLAIQDATSVIASSFAGVFADWMERRYPKRGRRWVLGMGSCLGSTCFGLHACNRLFPSIGFFATLPWFIVLRIFFSISTCLVFPVVDGMCLDFLKRHATPEEYGKERLFGAISWAITHLLMGPILDKYNNFGIFYFFGIAAALAMLITIQVYDGDANNLHQYHHQFKRRTSNLVLPDDEEISDNAAAPITPSKVTSQGDKNIRFLSFFAIFGSSCFSVTFLIARVTLASGQAVVDKMIFLFFEYLGSSFTLMSLTVLLTVVFEIPIFHVAPAILERIGSSGMLLLASFSYITRVVGYTLVPAGKTPLVLLFEPLHGVTYACSQSAGVDFASKLIPEPGMEASSQGFLQFFVGAGSAVGLLFGGFLEETYGPKQMYRVSSIVVLMGSLMFLGPAFQNRRSTLEQDNRVGHHVVPQDDEVDGVVEMTSSPTQA
ncbi:major facilitator superfamily MFS_1 protein [Nitzschia inconspicua]|uniref:Major facilitator superfamily MFS_1 protein n=1 Tax=Nitzschia inconspicua TaxID=303405 RepID=A0A9K3L9Y1_9STRA|nr:major facilitator superfamily MFS_1 protein [Nitzschia inconspicua]